VTAQPSSRAATPTAAPPADTRTKEMSERVVARFPSAKVDYVKPRRLKFTVAPDALRDVASFARDELGFDHFATVSGTDYIAKNEIEVIYFVGSVKPGLEDLVVAVAARTPRESPVVPSLVPVWPGAEYHEREAFEMLGVRFEGHPDLRGILLPEDWDDIPPLRKDYRSPGR
jgi:NADH:ubiquinone oxidoreductase subunit C